MFEDKTLRLKVSGNIKRGFKRSKVKVLEDVGGSN
jgi:hypothetical protein